MKTFTIAEGIEVQKEHLQCWEKVLLPEVFQKLNNYLLEKNKILDETIHTGYCVPRGGQIDALIRNYILGHEFGSDKNNVFIYNPVEK